MMTEYNYQRLMQTHYGCAMSALASMSKAISIYYPKRTNFIARKRLKSAIRISRTLKANIAKGKTKEQIA